jgi:hypothetical protein
MPGIELLARSHSHSGPCRCTTLPWPERLVETQKKGRSRSSISIAPKARRNMMAARRPRVSATSGNVQSDSGLPRTKAS